MPDLSRDNAAVIYRTAKEALANAGRHAQATRIWVHLGPADDCARPAVRLDVSDDGVGFPATGTDRRDEGHLGLRLAADRVRDIGGVLELRDRPGGGATVTAVVPADAV